MKIMENKNGFTLVEGDMHIDMPPTKARFAFTLAEVLITLGIIGIVAAMTIPNLIFNYKVKRTVSILKEDQSIIAQVIKLSTEENGEPEGWQGQELLSEARTLTLVDKINPFLKIAVDCGTYDENGNCFMNGDYKFINGTKYENFATDRTAYKIKLMNGSSLLYYSYPTPMFRIYFAVDINGEKQPNTVGKDLFYFEYAEDKGLFPLGAPNVGLKSEEYTTDCSLEASHGFGCAYYVLTFGNMDYLKK